MKSLRLRLRLLGISLLSGFLAWMPLSANAGPDEQVGNFFGNIILWILQSVAQLVAMVTHFLIIIAQYSDFTKNSVVTIGWNLVVDIANMIFIVALLIIAIGTVLRVQNYRYNRLLGNVIVMAFLVNFSKSIAAFFIQASQIVMLTFVDAFRDAAFGNFATMFGLEKVLTFSQTADPKAPLDVFASLLIGLFFLTVALITILALSIVLSVRIVMLWILVILSPFAYALRILPDTDRWAREWWSNFGKWVTTGPVIAFFLWLALAILSQSGNQTTSNQTSSWITSSPSVSRAISTIPPEEKDLYFKGTELLEIENFISFIIAIVFLWMGLQMATSTGGIAGKWAGKVATAGLAAYGTVSGLNALRDRTIAPIQGYLAQREARRKQGIAERSIALGARIDQGLGATVGQVGRARVAATAGLGALVRGKGLEAAVGAAAAGAKRGTRSLQQSQQRVEAFKAQKIQTRAGEVELSSPQVTINDLKGMAIGGDMGLATAATQELIKRNGLDHKDSRDLDILRRTTDYLGQRQLGTNFMKAVEGVDPELARKNYFGDISDPETRRKMQEAMQSRTVSSRILSREDLEYLTAPGNGAEAEEMSTFFTQIARNRDELKKMHEGVNEDYRDALMSRANMTGRSREERKTFAEVTGQVDRAFRDKNAAGTFELTRSVDATTGALVSDVKKFFVNRGKKLSDIISSSSTKSGELMAELGEDLTEKELTEIAAKSDFHRQGLKTGIEDSLRNVTYGLYGPTGASKTFNRAVAGYRPQETRRRALHKISRGEVNPYEDDLLSDPNAQESYGRLAKTLKAADAFKLSKNTKYQTDPAFKNTVDLILGMKMGVRELGELAGFSGDSGRVAEDAVKAAHLKGTTLGATPPPTDAEKKRAKKLETSEATSELI